MPEDYEEITEITGPEMKWTYLGIKPVWKVYAAQPFMVPKLRESLNVRQLTTNYYADYEPAWSPDGKQIAFASGRDGDSEIFVMDADGTNVRQLTTINASDVYPAWSPDGKQIAFRSSRYGGFEIFVMDADGSNVVSTTQRGEDPTFKP